jgi:hypothetical protein
MLLDLLAAEIATRLAAARDLAARATDVARGIDRASLADAGFEGGTNGAVAGRGRSGRGKVAAAAEASRIGTGSPGRDDESGAEDDGLDDSGGARTSVPAAERRRAAGILVGLWRELARDLLLVTLGEDRQVRDPALLDDLRVAAASLGRFPETSNRGPNPGRGGATAAGRGLGRFLGRLDEAGELLEANVRPELVLDALLLHWPHAGVR